MAFRSIGALILLLPGFILLERAVIVGPLRAVIVGRTAREHIVNPITDEMIVKENEMINGEAAARIEELGLETIRVRSSLTCESPVGICAKCYGVDLSTGEMAAPLRLSSRQR